MFFLKKKKILGQPLFIVVVIIAVIYLSIAFTGTPAIKIDVQILSRGLNRCEIQFVNWFHHDLSAFNCFTVTFQSSSQISHCSIFSFFFKLDIEVKPVDSAEVSSMGWAGSTDRCFIVGNAIYFRFWFQCITFNSVVGNPRFSWIRIDRLSWVLIELIFPTNKLNTQWQTSEWLCPIELGVNS